MLFEKLTETDKEMISSYISNYGTNPDHVAPNYYTHKRASLDYVLRHWDYNKESLYQLLGNNFIVQKHICLDVDVRTLVRRLDDMRWSTKEVRGSTYAIVFDRYFRWLEWACRQNWEAAAKRWFDFDKRYNRGKEVFLEETKFDIEALARNTYDGVAGTVIFPDTDKPYQLKPGMRISRILARMLQAYPDEKFGTFDTDELNKLIDIVSIARSSANTEFDLCLSIHPLDYMTMSDNDMGWSSCMCWRDHTGDYRQGTVECLNSPTVVIAYIREKNDMRLDFDTTWANKSWRQLFLIDKGAIVAVKGYPFQNESVVEVVLDWLRELARNNWGVEYNFNGYITHNGDNLNRRNDGTIYSFEDPEDINSHIAPDLSVHWDYMYDDLGTLSNHRVYANTEYIKNDILAARARGNKYADTYTITASGPCECMWCGGTLTWDDVSEDEANSMVFCTDCSPLENVSRCDYCGERFHDDDLIYVEDLDTYLCQECYDEQVVQDGISKEAIWKDDSEPIYLVLGAKEHEGSIKPFILDENPIWVRGDVEYPYDNDAMRDIFVDGENFTTHYVYAQSRWYSRWCNVVFPQELTKEGLKLFVGWENYFDTVEEAQEAYKVTPYDDEFVANLDRGMVWNTLKWPDMPAELDYNKITRHK